MDLRRIETVNCPNCEGDSIVKFNDKRKKKGTRKQRECKLCGHQFFTFTKKGKREKYEADKIVGLDRKSTEYRELVYKHRRLKGTVKLLSNNDPFVMKALDNARKRLGILRYK